MREVSNSIRAMFTGPIGKKVASSLLALCIAVSPVYQSAAVIASELEEDDSTTVIETVSESESVDADVAVVEETDCTVAETSETTLEEPEEISVPDETSGEVDAQAPPAEAEEVSETEASETLETSEAVSSETTETTETTITEQVEIPEETEEPVETVAEVMSPVVIAETSDEYYDAVAALPDGYQRVIVSTDADLTALEVAAGVYFDGTYILVFEDDATYVTAIQYLSDNGFEYFIDGVIGVCGSFGLSDAEVNPDATVKIAVIDTGSNVANEAYSVVGDDTADYNGHGTAMCEYVLNETDDAYIISIKAMGDDGRGNMSDVYAAVQMAEELDVDYILMALSIFNTGSYDAFVSLIENADATVIASAGNNGADASKYLPAGIDSVITVGAVTSDGYLQAKSNYGSCVEYYVMADSTSEAAAKLAGKIIAGTEDEVATGYLVEEEPVNNEDEIAVDFDDGTDNFYFITDYTGSWTGTLKLGSANVAISNESDFRSTVTNTIRNRFTGFGFSSVQCSIEQTGGGTGYVTLTVYLKKVTIDCSYGQGVYNALIRCYNSTGISAYNGAFTVSHSQMQNIATRINTSVINNTRAEGRPVAYAVYDNKNWFVAATFGNFRADSPNTDGDSNGSFYAGTNYNYCINPPHNTSGGASSSSVGLNWVNIDTTAERESMFAHNGTAGFFDRSEIEVARLIMAANVCPDVLGFPNGVKTSDNSENLTGAVQYSLWLSMASGTKNATVSEGNTYTITVENFVKVDPGTNSAKPCPDLFGYIQSNNLGETIDQRVMAALESSGSTGYRDLGSVAVTGTNAATVNGGTATFTLTNTNGTVNAADFVDQYTTANSTGVTINSVTTSGNKIIVTYTRTGTAAAVVKLDPKVTRYSPGGVEYLIQVRPNGDGSSGQSRIAAEARSSAYTLTGASVSSVVISFTKVSTNPACTNGNPMYSFAGTTYGLYASAANANADTNRLATITFDANGNTSTKYVTTNINGTFYAKELTAGQGYMLDSTVQTLKLTGTSRTFPFSDKPLTDPLSFDFIKKDYANWNMVTDVMMSNAVFEFYYYANTDNYTDFATYSASHTPTVHGTFQMSDVTTATNSTGRFTISVQTLATLFPYFQPFAQLDAPALPIGNYVIVEKTAPAGYELAASEFAWWVKQVGNAASHGAYNVDTATYVFTALNGSPVYLKENPKYGYADFLKTVTSNNGLEQIAPDLYSLDSTQYEVYTDADNLVMTLTFDATGHVKNVEYSSVLTLDAADKWTNGDTVKLPAGEYYIKELHSTKGYYLDTTAYTFTVTEGNTTDVEVSDKPIVAPFDFVLKVPESTTLSQEVLDLLSMEGAEFTVTYYNTVITDGNLNSAVPVMEATFVTDANGEFHYGSSWYTTDFAASTDAALAEQFKDATGNYVAVQGTYVVRETKAPANMTKSDTVLIIPVEFKADIVEGSADDPALSTAWAASMHTQVISGVVYDETTGKFTFPNSLSPIMSTTARNTASGDTELVATTSQSITDTVDISKLATGFSYKIEAWLVCDNGTPLDTSDDTYVSFDGATDSNGVPIQTVPVTYLTENSPVTLDIVFDGIDATNLEGCTITVCENVYIYTAAGSRYVFLSHTDVTDTKQQVTVPGIRTTLLDTAIDTFDASADAFGQYTNSTGYTKHAECGTDVTLTDYVAYTNLVPGREYTISGVLKNAETGESVLDADGNEYTGSTTFTAITADGVVEVYFEHVDTTAFTSRTVAFEDLKHNGFSVAVHQDLTDSWQTLTSPEISTEFLDTQSGSHEAAIGSVVEVTDTVELTRLSVGKTYTLETVIYSDTGIAATYTTTFVAGTDSDVATWGSAYEVSDGLEVVDGTVTVPVLLDTAKLVSVTIDADGNAVQTNTRIVATQKLYTEDVLVADHTDLNDTDQTIELSPDLRTTASNAETGTKTMTYSETVSLVDRVFYEDLKIGESYTVTGTLMNKETGLPLLDAEGNPYVESVTFAAPTASGYIDVSFEDVYVPYTVTSVVVFEDLEQTETHIKIAVHADLTDEDQTITRPGASTIATIDGKKEVFLGSTEVATLTITDTIAYKNLVPGRTYRIETALYKADGTVVMNGANAAYASTLFVPETADGETSITIVFTTDGFVEGDKVVVFEKIYDVAEDTEITDGSQTEDILIAVHEDLTDEDQTITVHFRPQTGIIDTPFAKIGFALIIAALGGYVFNKAYKKRYN